MKGESQEQIQQELDELGPILGHLSVQALTLLPRSFHRLCLETLVTYLNSNDRMSKNIVIPVRVGGPAPIACDDNDAVTIMNISQRPGAGLTTPGPDSGEQEQGGIGKWTANLAAIGAKLCDYRLVEIVEIAHYYVFLQVRDTMTGRNGTISQKQQQKKLGEHRKRDRRDLLQRRFREACLGSNHQSERATGKEACKSLDVTALKDDPRWCFLLGFSSPLSQK